MTNKTQRRNARRASARPERKRFAVSQSLRDKIEQNGYIPTYNEVKALYGPAKTLGAPKEAVLAMDHSLDSGGAYSLLQHAFEHGQFPALGPSFMGYAALSSLTQNGLIRACIETLADDMTREWIEIDAVDDNGLGEEKKKLQDAMIDYRIHDICHKAAEFDGYFGGCLIFIDTGAKDDLLLTPLDISEKSAELKDFKRFTLIEPINIFPGTYESTDPLSPSYYKPQTWWVLGKQVHSSRLIRVCGNEVPVILKPTYNFLGLPQAQILYDYVIHFQDARQAEARLLEKFSLTVLKTDMEDILTNPNATGSLDPRLEYMAAYRTNDGVLAIDKEMEDIVNIVTPMNGVTDIVRQQLEFVVMINRTNVVKTLGLSPAGFNSGDADIKNNNDHTSSQQEKVLRGPLQKMLDVLQIVVLGSYEKSVKFKFVGLNEEDDAAIATTQKTKADTDAVLIEEGVISQAESRKRLSEDPHSGYSGIEIGDLPESGHGDETQGGEGDQGKRWAPVGVSKEA
ncbi:anti-CBASS protein Acb1 family protein [Rouxiella sp. WC2420]|uniref:Phage portal protein n=1 Tax=Rouxiella sp. WC2420 TaxID=3234145 RepID=A0AB39VKC9_9GAMM